MSGHTKFNDLKHKASPEQLAEARLELADATALHELRTALGFTQKQLAETLGMTQPGISRLEGQTDLLLSTLSSYVEALGGELRLCVQFGDTEVTIKSLGDLEQDLAPSTRQKVRA